MKMINQQNLFTLIICTFNRSEWLVPTLKTLTSFKFKIIVMDGSSDSLHLEKNQIAINKLNENHCNLIRYYIDKGSYLARLKTASLLVDTAYCRISADDDLFSAEYVNDAIAKLQLNPDIAAVEGAIDSYDINRRQFMGFTDQYYHSDLASTQILTRGMASSYRPGTFGVMPINVLKLCSNLSLEAEEFIVDDFTNGNLLWAAGRFTDLIFRNVTLFSGIIVKSEHLMLFRFYHGENLGSKLARNNKQSTFFLDKRIQSYMEILCDRMASELKLPINDIRSIIFYDHFSDIARRLQTIKDEMKSSAGSDLQNFQSRGLEPVYKNFTKKILIAPVALIRWLLAAVRGGMKGKHPAKKESLILIKTFLINFDNKLSG